MNTTQHLQDFKGKWLQLKLTMLPIIAVEIQNYINEYKRIVQLIESEAEKEQREDDHELLITYSQLRACIKARQEELQTFYDENADDEKIHFFEKLRLKLKKTLQQRPKAQQRDDVSQLRSDFSEDVSIVTNELERAPEQPAEEDQTKIERMPDPEV